LHLDWPFRHMVRRRRTIPPPDFTCFRRLRGRP
jgi:hypothetical protein